MGQYNSLSLHRGVINDDVKLVSGLLKGKSDVNELIFVRCTKDNFGQVIMPNIHCVRCTPLALSIILNRKSMFDMLMVHQNIDINQPSEESQLHRMTPLGFAINYGREDMARELINDGADINAGIVSKYALASAERKGGYIGYWSHEQAVSPILMAMRKKMYDLVKKLVNVGATLGDVLDCIVYTSDVCMDMVEYLMEKKAHINILNIINKCKHAPYVEYERYTRIMSMAFKYDVCTHTEEALKVARVNNMDSIVKLIESHQTMYNPRISINDIDKLGNTKLHCAVMNNDVDVVKDLLKSGADTTIRNNDHATPVDIANINKYTHLVHLIENHTIGKKNISVKSIENVVYAKRVDKTETEYLTHPNVVAVPGVPIVIGTPAEVMENMMESIPPVPQNELQSQQTLDIDTIPSAPVCDTVYDPEPVAL